jgi:hypothetical protein
MARDKQRLVFEGLFPHVTRRAPRQSARQPAALQHSILCVAISVDKAKGRSQSNLDIATASIAIVARTSTREREL